MKKFCNLMVITTFLMTLFVFVSCGSETEDGNDDKNGNDNETADIEDNADTEETDIDSVDEEEVLDDAVELVYPEPSVTSKKVGDIARNLFFNDYTDTEKQLAQWHKPNNEKIRLIWLVISTYDCPSCVIEKKDIPDLNKKYAKEGMQTILIMNGLLAGPKPNEEPAKIAATRDTMLTVEGDAADHVYGYLTYGQQTEFKKFINTGYPVNVFIDANTMEILKHFEGWAKEDEFVQEVDDFIDAVLDFL
jgi:hypothetical protein